MQKRVYLNHDGGVDDLVSLFLLLQMEDIDLAGVGVTPADCYLEPAVYASRKIIDRFGKGKKTSKLLVQILVEKKSISKRLAYACILCRGSTNT